MKDFSRSMAKKEIALQFFDAIFIAYFHNISHFSLPLTTLFLFNVIGFDVTILQQNKEDAITLNTSCIHCVICNVLLLHILLE